MRLHVFKLLILCIIFTIVGVDCHANDNKCSDLFFSPPNAFSTQEFKPLDSVITLSSDNQDYHLGWVISQPSFDFGPSSSSYVYLSTDQKFIVKLYDREWDLERSSARSQSFYEFWATQYLRDKGFTFVLPVIDYFRTDKGYVIVRPYEKKVESAPRYASQSKAWREKQEALIGAYNSIELVQYIKSHSNIRDPVRILNGFYVIRRNKKIYVWHNGDFRGGHNWILTSRGWRLIDP